MNPRKTIVAILATLLAAIALADDFKTINGKEYKNVEVGRVEPDGLVLWSKSSIVKVYFSELPKEVVDKWLPPAEKERIAEKKAADEKHIQEQKAAEREREEKEKNAEADLKRALEQFQAAERRAAQSYQNAAKGILSGQVFVSTAGGENFKLGAVQASLFARDATDILLAGLKAYADAKIQQLSPIVEAAKAAQEQANSAYADAIEASSRSIGRSNFESAMQAELEARETATRKADEYSKISQELKHYYSGVSYFSYLHSPIETAETDADGKFAIEVPRTGAFVVAAQAKRSVGVSIEYYYWLQPINLGGQQQRVQNLSNNNLTSTTGTSSLILTKD